MERAGTRDTHRMERDGRWREREHVTPIGWRGMGDGESGNT